MSENREPFDGVDRVASFTECTGLIPALPQDEYQDVNLSELYATHKGKKSRRMYPKR